MGGRSRARWGPVAVLLAGVLAGRAAAGARVGRREAPAGGGGLVVNTWAFTNATERAYEVLAATGQAMAALEQGLAVCEVEQCDGSVGYGGSPDERGETTLDALVMDGETMDIGAVADLRGVPNAAAAAAMVLKYSKHTILAGQQASDFAEEMGLAKSSLETQGSAALFKAWMGKDCQPNYRQGVYPDPETSCGPYSRLPDPGGERGPAPRLSQRYNRHVRQDNHDTIAMVIVGDDGHVVSGASTNGANHKVPGRVGDSPIPGAGSYAMNGVGGCGCTGDGDTMMRFLPCYQVVESMRLGMSAKDAAEDAVARIRRFYPSFLGALIAVGADGTHAGAVNCWQLTYSVRGDGMREPQTFQVDPAVPCPPEGGAP